MTGSKRTTNKPSQRRRSPKARSTEGRERQLVDLALDEAEKQIRAGTASSQVLTHFLKLGSVSEALAREKLSQENKLLLAKTQALESARNVEKLYEDAIVAMRRYSGQKEEIDED